MTASLVQFLSNQPTMRIIKGLLQSHTPLHLRDLASRYSISPAGVSDIIRRLNEAGVLKESQRGNRRCFSLVLPHEEADCLRYFFSVLEKTLLEKRAIRFSLNAQAKLLWMDEAYEFYQGIKK